MIKFKKTIVKDSGKKSGEEKQAVLVSSSDTYYDDCPICQAMKKAEEEGRSLSEEEMIKLFEEANKKNSHQK